MESEEQSDNDDDEDQGADAESDVTSHGFAPSVATKVEHACSKAVPRAQRNMAEFGCSELAAHRVE